MAVKNSLPWIVGTSLLLMNAPLFSAIFWDIDTTVPLHCEFSSTHQNRILVDGGRIQKVIFPQVKIDVQMEEESGQVFVYPLDRYLDEVTLSVVTDTCVVQDLVIHFREEALSEVVVLQEPKPCTPEEVSCQPYDEAQQIALAIQSVLSRQAPEGYIHVSHVNECRTLNNGLFVETVARFDGACDSLYLYHVLNTSRRSQSIYEQHLYIPRTRWIYLEKHVLMPKESILVVVAVHP